MNKRIPSIEKIRHIEKGLQKLLEISGENFDDVEKKKFIPSTPISARVNELFYYYRDFICTYVKTVSNSIIGYHKGRDADHTKSEMYEKFIKDIVDTLQNGEAIIVDKRGKK